MKLLIIEDDPDLSSILKRGFSKKGYTVETATDGFDGDELAFVNEYDLIILDLNLPNMDGLEILKHIREEKPQQRVIILSARSSIDDKIEGLDLGANDYVAKPFDFRELEARVRNLLGKNFIQGTKIIKYSYLELNTNSKAIMCNGIPLDLPPKELAIIEYLLHNIGRAVGNEELIEHIWDSEADLFSVSAKPHISRLRKKIQDCCGKELITTVRGSGYLLPKEGQ